MSRRKAYKKGLWAEIFAALYLMARGYRILRWRYKTKGGEIDLIARKRRVLVMIEVKARKVMIDALESVNVRTQVRIENATRYFLSEYPEYAELDVRFDVIAWDRKFRLQHLDNAWFSRS